MAVINGTTGNDILTGTSGDDTITPLSNTSYDRIIGSLGNDTIDFTGANSNSFYELYYHDFGAAIQVTINDLTNTGTITSGAMTDTLVNVSAALVDGIYIEGTSFGDTFDMVLGNNGYFNLVPGDGVDSISFNADDNVRIKYRGTSLEQANQGLVINLATGVVSNDGFGNVEQLNYRGGTGQVEIQATDFNDSILGSDRDESFITERGNDTVDGAGGYDRIRYDRSGSTGIVADLTKGTIEKVWDGQTFTDTISNIEYINGSNFNDTMIGDGTTTLFGDGGDDLIQSGAGREFLYGGNGDDTIDASAGDRTTEGIGDYIAPYYGTDAIIGNADLWASGNGIDVTYYHISGAGGVTVTRGANGGTTTVVSGTNGLINDTITYLHQITGTADDDTFIGSSTESSGISIWAGYKGNDTITGGSWSDGIFYRFDDVLTGIDVTFTAIGTGTAQDGFGGTDTFTGIEGVVGSYLADKVTGSDGVERFLGEDGNDTLTGNGGNDTLEGGLGGDTLVGGDGDDFLFGGEMDDDLTDDIRDVIYGGDGNDSIDGGYGNDELRGDAGDDSIEGGYGVDTVIGGDGNDVLTGSAWSDQIFGGNGNDFINGGFGFDRVNGGLGADKFYHTNAAGHGSDWIQDYNAAEGDVLFFGGGAATKADFLVQRASTPDAGSAAVQEVFITHLPSGNLLWALVDGDGQSSLNVLAAGQTFDLLA
ncbi:calcium-binding protein [Pseudoprimorskyibacter insulae]|uniref:Bifunctional hemolysin/adenylate cyclase n=1 Tax=Pseudoprimorskyibacter insulae TaxID=1695997 RepID=A0A2R8AQ84_9RHOB|nr:calcium-binding protein [Pseudoprimorskyibacter insulae]SPF78202.1 Bifunctional hemolysin/adenylate cyclase [Pseudoprimorskyibacter insulae]